MSVFSVFGNPIRHSKSPQIYSIFAKEFGISQVYTRMLAFWMNFDQILKEFFYLGGMGANITMPFKERAFLLCDKLTSRAFISGSVNTIKREDDGLLLGDNTDGIGLLGDLHRLNWLTSCSDSRNSGKRVTVLLLGAGGASKGVILSLLDFGCQIEVVNRTLSRAQQVVESYKHLGRISLANFSDKNSNGKVLCKYDLIINATTGSWFCENVYSPMLPVYFITPTVACYDMSYSLDRTHLTPFVAWCKKNGARRYSDGLGMLVIQAAHSFLLWHGVFPSVTVASVFNQLK